MTTEINEILLKVILLWHQQIAILIGSIFFGSAKEKGESGEGGRLQRRRQRNKACCASEKAELRESQLATQRVKDRARRAARTEEQRQHV